MPNSEPVTKATEMVIDAAVVVAMVFLVMSLVV